MNEVVELEKDAEQYRRDGYQVALRPRGSELPSFLKNFEPDLIARSENENVVIEVKEKSDLPPDQELGYLTALVNAQPGWRLDVVVTNLEPWPDRVAGDATERSVAEVRQLAQAAERLMALGEQEAASMIAWSAVEAAMRQIANKHAIPLEIKSPSFVLKTLYAEGLLSRSDYERLREALHTRNAVAHGLKIPELRPEFPEFLIEVARRLLDAASSNNKRKARRVGVPG